VIHYFVNGAIAELRCCGRRRTACATLPRVQEEPRLRDLLKPSSSSSRTDVFREELAAEVELHDPHWEKALRRDRRRSPSWWRASPLGAPRAAPVPRGVPRGGRHAVRHDVTAAVEEEPFLREALALGRQHALSGASRSRSRCRRCYSPRR
jgi:hypothetical protein